MAKEKPVDSQEEKRKLDILSRLMQIKTES